MFRAAVARLKGRYMKQSVSTISAALLTCLALSAAPAQAQSRVFVAAQGSDSNPCTFASPCRTFQHAHDVVVAGGEIDVLDPGGYGALFIFKPISIQGHGFSGISVANGAVGINILAGVNDAVHLNGVLIDGVGTGNTGIQFNTGKSLTVENCIVRNLSFSGLFVGNNGANSLVLTVSNSYFADNGGNGIIISPNGSGAVKAAIDRTVLSGNGFAGLNVLGQGSTGGVHVTVTDSVAAHNKNGSQGNGFLVQSDGSHSVATLMLARTTAVDNFVGISAFGDHSILVVGQSTVTHNTTGYSAANSGFISTYVDNYVDLNGSNTGSLSSVSKE
jgi:hypothetical protein